MRKRLRLHRRKLWELARAQRATDCRGHTSGVAEGTGGEDFRRVSRRQRPWLPPVMRNPPPRPRACMLKKCKILPSITQEAISCGVLRGHPDFHKIRTSSRAAAGNVFIRWFELFKSCSASMAGGAEEGSSPPKEATGAGVGAAPDCWQSRAHQRSGGGHGRQALPA